MSAAKKSSTIVLCLSLAVAGLLGVFAIMDASSANASQGEVTQPAPDSAPSTIISPKELISTLYTDGVDTLILWITNTSNVPITYTIYEMNAPLRQAATIFEPAANPVVDPAVMLQASSHGKVDVIIHLRQKADLSAATQIRDRAARAQYVFNQLQEIASHSRGLVNWLTVHGAQPSQLWISNAIAATLDSAYDVPWLVTGPLAVELQPGGVITHQVGISAAGMQPGVYHAGIAIKSNDPQARFTTLGVSLEVYAPCEPLSEVIATVSPPNPVVGEEVTFTASASGTQPITYTWAFDDGTSATGVEVTHVFESRGTHAVGLRLENTCDLVEMEIQVAVEADIRRILMPLIWR